MENNKLVVFRVDASVKIGSGHVMRCLTLAGQLKETGSEVIFICSDLPGNLASLIVKDGYRVFLIPYLKVSKDEKWKRDLENTVNLLTALNNPIDLLVVDHYGLDYRWEAPLRKFVKEIMVIDDLANRPHDCDILLDQNLYNDMDIRYEGLVPEHCKKLLGPKNVLLRPEFYEARRKLRLRDGTVKRILVFFGGSDPSNETGKALEAIRMLNRPDIAVDVVVGSSNPYKNEIHQICEAMPNTSYYCQVDNMAELMAKADLAIGAGGTAAWERCFLGLPTATVIIADNQSEQVKLLAKKEAIWNLGHSKKVTSNRIFSFLNNVIHDITCVRKASNISILIIN